MVESDLGTMVINESEEEDDGTMKRKSPTVILLYFYFRYKHTVGMFM